MRNTNTLAAGLCALLLAATLLSANPLVRAAENYSRSIVTSSIAVYASLRAINAFLSTAQEIEVGASFVASGSAQPLKMLEPLDDTVERVASVVLTVTMVSGVMILGFSPVAGIGYTLVLLGWIASRVPRLRDVAREAMRLGLIMGLVVPVAFIVAGSLGDLVTQNVLREHETLLASLARDISPQIEASTMIESTSEPASDGVSGWVLSPLSGMTEKAAAMKDVMAQILARLEESRDAAQMLIGRSDELLSSYVQIIGAYVLKGVMLPVLLMLIALYVARRAPSAAGGKS